MRWCNHVMMWHYIFTAHTQTDCRTYRKEILLNDLGEGPCSMRRRAAWPHSTDSNFHQRQFRLSLLPIAVVASTCNVQLEPSLFVDTEVAVVMLTQGSSGPATTDPPVSCCQTIDHINLLRSRLVFSSWVSPSLAKIERLKSVPQLKVKKKKKMKWIKEKFWGWCCNMSYQFFNLSLPFSSAPATALSFFNIPLIVWNLEVISPLWNSSCQ